MSCCYFFGLMGSTICTNIISQNGERVGFYGCFYYSFGILLIKKGYVDLFPSQSLCIYFLNRVCLLTSIHVYMVDVIVSDRFWADQICKF